MPKLRSVTTYKSAIKVLGGTAEAARALKTTPPQICKWRERHGAFPADQFYRVQAALKPRGYQAEPKAFTFLPAR